MYLLNNNNDYTNHIKSNCKDNDIIITPINNNIYKYTDIIRDIKNPLLHNDDEQINEMKSNIIINVKIKHLYLELMMMLFVYTTNLKKIYTMV